jgi:hypothetical protein
MIYQIYTILYHTIYTKLYSIHHPRQEIRKSHVILTKTNGKSCRRPVAARNFPLFLCFGVRSLNTDQQPQNLLIPFSLHPSFTHTLQSSTSPSIMSIPAFSDLAKASNDVFPPPPDPVAAVAKLTISSSSSPRTSTTPPPPPLRSRTPRPTMSPSRSPGSPHTRAQQAVWYDSMVSWAGGHTDGGFLHIG